MAKNDFDIDFDFEEEYGFDPKAFLGTDEYDENVDLGEFSDEELGLKDPQESQEEAAPEEIQEEEELPFDPLEGFGRESFAAGDPPYYQEQPEEEASQDEPDYSEEEAYPEEGYDQSQEEGSQEDYAPQEPQPEEPPKKVKKPRQPKPKKEFHTPKFLEKFYDLYFAPLSNPSILEEPQDPKNPRRRRRKSRSQIFKEVYLPPILVCLCAVLVLSFLMGSVAGLISQYREDKDRQQAQLQDSSSAADLADQAYNQAINEAEALVEQYDYQGAIAVLEEFEMSEYYDQTAHANVGQLRANYSTIDNGLVEYADPSTIPNLSFHPLINDMSRAKKNTELWGSYNKNFVTVQEFKSILNAIYSNGYVLVDFDSFIGKTSSTDGKDSFHVTPIRLPQGKKPIMITETLVSYMHYMITDVEKGEADANGDGFASKLVVRNGEIEAEYVDGSGATLTGDYDLVPILEDFIQAHPDFVYQGARATLAVTGKEGIFGYRTNTEYISTKGQTYYDDQLAGAKEVVAALRDKGYRIACFTYGNVNYKTLSAQQIQEDLNKWRQQIAEPVLGTVDTIIFAQTGNISEYSGTVFDMLYQTGFRYFVSNGASPWAEVNTTYVRQNRVMVTGENMAWHKDYFTNIFDPNTILDAQSRGDVPTSG